VSYGPQGRGRDAAAQGWCYDVAVQGWRYDAAAQGWGHDAAAQGWRYDVAVQGWGCDAAAQGWRYNVAAQGWRDHHHLPVEATLVSTLYQHLWLDLLTSVINNKTTIHPATYVDRLVPFRPMYSW
jgi:hypothetical protein